MDWSNLRGTAINNPPPKERDLDLIQFENYYNYNRN